MRKRLSIVLKVAFGVCMLWLVARGLDVNKVRELAGRGDPKDLALGVSALLISMMYFQWIRLHVLIKGFTGGIPTSLKIFYVGALFNNVLPSNIGGDAVRLVYLKNLKSDNWGTPFMLLLLHRLSGFVVLIAAGLLYVGVEHNRLLKLAEAQHLPIHFGDGKGGYVLAAGVLALGLAALVARKLSDRMRSKVLGFLNNCRAAFAAVSRRDFAWLMLYTFCLHFSRMVAFYFLVRYLGQQVALWDLVFVISATAIVAVLPVTVAGLGLVEGSISSLLALFGVAGSAAVAVAVVNRVVLLLMAAIGYVVYLMTRDQLVPTTTLEPTV